MLIEKAVNYIHKNLNNIRSPQEVARELNVSYESFRKKFKQKMKISPGKYIEILQLIEFAKSLNDINLTIKQAVPAYYRDTDYAIKRFKKYFGITPTEYRRSYLDSYKEKSALMLILLFQLSYQDIPVDIFLQHLEISNELQKTY